MAHIWNGSDVFSYDISEDAIAFGKLNFKNVKFICKAINIDDIFAEAPFDIILCKEFYPFTRSLDMQYHIAYLETFLKNLRDNGMIIVSLADTDKCMMRNIDKIIKALSEKVQFKIFKVPSIKVYTIVKNIFLSNLLTLLIGRNYRKDDYIIIITYLNSLNDTRIIPGI